MKLAIISHTEHYTTEDGTLVGWSPTVNEINHLLGLFDTIYHLAMHYDGLAPKSTMAYTSERIQFIPLPAVGGQGIKHKLNIILNAPKIIRIVSKTLEGVDYFQLRTPTGIGVFLIPYLSLVSNQKGWYKYAGNWNQKHPPFGYALQRWMLKHQRHKVTINGQWQEQPKHCLSFENPCLTEADLMEVSKFRLEKNIEGSLTLCFVGRLEAEKGVGLFLKALKLLTDTERRRIENIHFVGEGNARKAYESEAKTIGLRIHFHGALSRDAVFKIYKNSHALVMPTTASEGFPKVLAEAMAFGCIPIVSDLSSISQYIKHQQQGLLLHPVTAETLLTELRVLLNLKQEFYTRMLSLQTSTVQQFTFDHYMQQLNTHVLTQTKVF